MDNSQLSAALAAVDLDTPCLVLDEAKLARNIARMNAIAARLGVRLRPHVKTAKCTQVARRIFAGDIGPITVSTLKEAEYFFADGFRDFLYAVSIAPAKLGRVAALVGGGARVCLVVDSMAALQAMAQAAQHYDVVFDVSIEIDADGHRAGLRPDDPLLITLARYADDSAELRFNGVMTHAGGSYDCRGSEALRAHARLERDAVVLAAQRLRAAAVRCDSVSVGSTPTLSVAQDLSGVTEARVGVYVFYDLVQSNLGVCSVEDIALSVLTTVISHKYDSGRLIVDAGGLALSKDRGTAQHALDYRYGQVCALDGQPMQGLCVSDVNQEHGLITPADAADAPAMFAALPIGARLRILPNHACMTAAAYEAYQVAGTQGLSVWPRCNGW